MNALVGAVGSIAAAAIVSTSWAEQAAQVKETPVLAWNRVALESIERAKPTQHEAARLLAYLSVAQHAVVTGAANDEASRAGIAAVSMRMIAGLMPTQAAFVDAEAQRWQPQDAQSADRIGQRLLEQARADGFSAKWTGQVPQAAFAWRSLAAKPAAPAYPAIGGMRTLMIEAGDALRPSAPPAIGSDRFMAALAEVKRHTSAPTDETRRLAKFYDMTTGTLAAGFWNEQAAELVRRDGLGERQTTVVLATMNAAIMDALVACHDAKYAYWVPRPSQADPTIKPLIGVPNHPSYPSNHACLSTAAAQVLAHFFPQDRTRLERIGEEARVSRIYAGLHYRFDTDAGEEIGDKVAAAAISRYAQVLGQAAQRLLAATERDAVEVPDSLKPRANELLAMIVPARGVQIYACRAVKDQPGAYAWTFVAPQADLYDTRGNRVGRHYAGPHWEANDGSVVVGTLKERAAAPIAGAIPWLLLEARSVGAQGSFASVSSIQRINTVGGAAPSTGCSAQTAGAEARIGYTADYHLFARAGLTSAAAETNEASRRPH